MEGVIGVEAKGVGVRLSRLGDADVECRAALPYGLEGARLDLGDVVWDDERTETP